MKIGVFDSGIGGEAVASALRSTFPDAAILTVNDRANVPYGSKTTQEVVQLTTAAIAPLIDARCDVIVIACNTATALAIEPLRSAYPSQKFIGIEPMLKTAAQLTRTSTVILCATPATLASDRYADLVQKYGTHLTIIEPDCREWAYLIENNQINRTHIESTIREACDKGADVIVLGCTHYHWIKDLIIDVAGDRVAVIEPSDAIGRRVKQLLQLS